MDFESPDVEKEFPGLYASESAKKSNESDFSDEGVHEKHLKKELLGGKKKDKKDRKDRGYATLEGESSPDEDQESKSPSKSKKSKTFKFPSKKREKSREKDSKEKDADKDKDKKKRDKDDKHKDDKEDKDKRKDKEKDNKDKIKIKLKEKKKGKHAEEGIDIGEAQPIFGVSLHLAVERSRCHDGVELPLVIRNCIDYLQEFGMTTEGLYKLPSVKSSKVQNFKRLYNQRESVNIAEFDPIIAASLLILFFKELPEPVLESSEMISKFEQAASTKDVSQREYQLSQLVAQLSECNRTLLAWVTLHLDNVANREKTTKMNAQAIAMTLSPVLQMSHRLLLALLCHCKALFPDNKLDKYIPPLPSGSTTTLPDDIETIGRELAKQESLLSQIHMQMNDGFVTKSKEEQLWEVQRIITQLKRKYKTVQKLEGQVQRSLDQEEAKSNDENQAINRQSTCMSVTSNVKKVDVKTFDDTNGKLDKQENIDSDKPIISNSTGNDVTDSIDDNSVTNNEKFIDEENSIERLRESLIYEELINLKNLLGCRIIQERNEIKRLNDLIVEKGPEILRVKEVRAYSPNEAEITAMIQLAKENQLLEKKMMTLIKSIIEEKDACVELRVQLAIHQLTAPNNV